MMVIQKTFKQSYYSATCLTARPSLSLCSLIGRAADGRESDGRRRPDGGAPHDVPGRLPAVPAGGGAVAGPGPGGRAGGQPGRPLHTVGGATHTHTHDGENHDVPDRFFTLILNANACTRSGFT